MTEIREKLTIIAARLCTDIPLSTFEDDYYRIGIKEILIEHEAQDKKLKETALVLKDIIKALAKAEADTKRLDWIEKNYNRVKTTYAGTNSIHFLLGETTTDNIRDLIDKCK